MKKPEFNDVFEKRSRKHHKSFDGYVVEVLYGAKDENGNPCQPKEGADDGHGRWYGIEVNGDYRMFSWTHSKDEGGNTEYGTSHEDNALEALKNDLAKKQELARTLEKLTREGDEAVEEKVEAIKNEWASIENWNTPADAELQKRYDNALAEYGPKMESYKANKTLKEELVAKVEALKDSTNFRDARNELNALKDQLREIGSAGREAEDALRQRVRDVEKELRDKQRDYQANRDEKLAEAKVKKEEIIKKTKELVAGVSNWKATGDKLNGLMDEWKAAGFAGRDVDDALWEEFNTIRKDFRQKRQAFFDERKQQWDASIEAKKNLIAKAAEISATGDYGKKNTDAMKQLDVDWKAAGYSGKDQNDALWDEFNKTKEAFWETKRANAMQRVQAGLDAKKKELEDLKKKIEDLEFRITIAPNPAMKEDVERELYLRQNEAEDLAEEIEEEEAKLSK